MTLRFRPTLWLSTLVLLVPLARAQPAPDAKWTASDAHVSQAFGSAVVLEGAVAVVGAPGDDPEFNTLDYGAAFVFRYDGNQWVEEQKLTKPQPGMNDLFGRSVALALGDITDGTSNTLLVGMNNEEGVESGAGAVYVYQQNGSTWEHTATISASDGAAGDGFSYGLGADYPDTVWVRIIAGAPRHSLTDFNREGAAYMYRYENGVWAEDVKLTASDAAVSASFGESVAISGDRVLIGAPGDRAGGVGQNAGAAYVFEYEGDEWVEVAKLTASDAEGQAAFGGAVALDGDRALIGARLDDELGGGAGAAYVFRFDGNEWTEEQKLTASDNTGFNLFGSAVALEGTQALVGAENWAPEGGDAPGKVYLFVYDESLEQWQEVEDGLVPSDGGAGDHFGSAVALDAGVALVGAPEHGLPVGGNGAVYVYGEPVATSAEAPLPSAPVALSPPSPNPFRGRAALTLTLTDAQAVTVAVYDLLGRRVAVLHEGMAPVGTHRLVWEARAAAPGLYVVRAEGEAFRASRRIVLVR